MILMYKLTIKKYLIKISSLSYIYFSVVIKRNNNLNKN